MCVCVPQAMVPSVHLFWQGGLPSPAPRGQSGSVYCIPEGPASSWTPFLSSLSGSNSVWGGGLLSSSTLQPQDFCISAKMKDFLNAKDSFICRGEVTGVFLSDL